jgi:NAD(P)-dependent dehydrogenase (short-subunit alcohol dehydrogenase family)
MRWSHEDLPRMDGKTALVTGGNSGLGLQAVTVLAARGARVLLACRTAAKGEEQAARLRAAQPDARIEVVALDLADLASVRSLPQRLPADVGALDVLDEQRRRDGDARARSPKDGFEMQLGTNHLGHFALTARLFADRWRKPGEKPAWSTVSRRSVHKGRSRWTSTT